MSEMPKARKVVEPIILLLIVFAVVVLGLRWTVTQAPFTKPVTLWLINMGLLLAFTVLAGHAITGHVRGVLIDSRNKISLSRLQMLLWTILILSGFLTAALINLRLGRPDALSIALQTELWALLGISTTSLVGSPLIKNNKKAEPTNRRAEAESVSRLADQGSPTNVRAEGQILSNEDPRDASWTDIFKGEEVGNAAHLDLGKVQMFFFTLVVWFAYAIALGNLLRGDSASPDGGLKEISAFPALDNGMVALLGISHAGYLANKAVPHTPPPTVTSPL